MMRTQQGGTDKAPTAANDVATLQNEQVVYVSNENYKNSLKEAKHQQEPLKVTWGHWLGRSTGFETTEANIYQSLFQDYCQSFSGIPNYSKNFYLSWCCSNFQPFSKQIQSISNKIQKHFKPNHKSPVQNIELKLFCKIDPLPLKVKISKPLMYFFKIICLQICKIF